MVQCGPPNRVRFKVFQDVAGVRIWVFKNPTDVRKTPRPPKAAEKFWPFFFGAKSGFQWENDKFWSISESHGCKISDIFNFDGRKLLDLFWGIIERRGEKKQKNRRLSKFLENFANFCVFFLTMVSIGKVHFSAKCLFGRIGG